MFAASNYFDPLEVVEAVVVKTQNTSTVRFDIICPVFVSHVLNIATVEQRMNVYVQYRNFHIIPPLEAFVR